MSNMTLAVLDSGTARLGATVEFDLRGLEESLFEQLRRRLEGPEQRWLTVKGAATYMDASPAAVRQLIRRGHLRAYRPAGGSLRLSASEIDEWIRAEA